MSRNILERVARGAVVGDGAMGTRLYSKGIYINRCFDELNLAEPALVREVHRSLATSWNACSSGSGFMLARLRFVGGVTCQDVSQKLTIC